LESIINRAQALFVATAIFGFLFTFGTDLLTAKGELGPIPLSVCIVISSYILVQIVIMVVNILRAIGGIEYPRAGSSDMARWMGLRTLESLYRDQAILILSQYRRIALYNNWRFNHLDQAWKGLRNTVFAVGVLILLLFAFAIFRSSHS
jgi:predicted small integral membrane protein